MMKPKRIAPSKTKQHLTLQVKRKTQIPCVKDVHKDIEIFGNRNEDIGNREIHKIRIRVVSYLYGEKQEKTKGVCR